MQVIRLPLDHTDHTDHTYHMSEVCTFTSSHSANIEQTMLSLDGRQPRAQTAISYYNSVLETFNFSYRLILSCHISVTLFAVVP